MFTWMYWNNGNKDAPPDWRMVVFFVCGAADLILATIIFG